MTTDTALAGDPPTARSGRLLLGPFAIEGRRVTSRKTGNSAPIDLRLAREVASWLGFQTVLRARTMLLRVAQPPGPAIWFTPDAPGP